MVLLMTILPNICEASVAAGIAKGMTDMPIEVCFALGYVLANCAASILVPNYLHFNDLKLGKAKGVGSTMIASCAFDNIHCIIAFGVCRTLSLNNAAVIYGKSSGDTAFSIGMLIV